MVGGGGHPADVGNQTVRQSGRPAAKSTGHQLTMDFHLKPNIGRRSFDANFRPPARHTRRCSRFFCWPQSLSAHRTNNSLRAARPSCYWSQSGRKETERYKILHQRPVMEGPLIKPSWAAPLNSLNSAAGRSAPVDDFARTLAH